MNTAKNFVSCDDTCVEMPAKDSIQWEAYGETILFPKDYTFIETDQLIEYCYYVKKGRVLSYHLYPNGEERFFELHDEGQLFLENSLLFEAHSPVSYKTMCQTELVRINKCRIKKAIKEEPLFALAMMNQTSYKYQSSMERFRNATTQNVNWKVCDFFLTFAERYGKPYKDRILIQEKINQQFISNYIGVNRITVVRVVKDLKYLQLIDKNEKFYYVCDVKGLKEYQRMIDKNFEVN